MNKFLIKTFLFFICFPFIQIIPTDSYNQPYYIILAVIVFFVKFNNMSFIKKDPFVIGFFFFLTGLGSFIMNCYPYENAQDYKSLLTYFSFFLIPIVSFYLCRHHKLLLIKFLKVSIITWFIVGFVQAFIYLDFLNFLLGNFSSHSIVGSIGGRGVIGLAPEPTHYGFHILLLGIALYSLDKNKWYLLLTFLQAIVFAKSSSAMLAIIVGLILYLLFHNRRFSLISFFLIVIMNFLYDPIINFIDQFIFEDSSRIIQVSMQFLKNPTLIFISDASINARLGGLFGTFQFVFEDFFLPHSISQKSWINATIELMQKNKWILYISESQSPSGVGSVLFQIGFLFFPYLFILVKSIYKVVKKDKLNYFSYIVLVICLSQFSLVSGDIGLVFGVFIFIVFDLTQNGNIVNEEIVNVE